MVTVKGENINQSLIKAGLAWHFKKYDKNAAWTMLENKAKKEKKGLWVKPGAIAPWQWRDRKRAENSQ